MPVYLSDRGFLASRGLSYTFPGTTTTLDAAFPITHNLGAVPSALELWVEQSAGVWEKHDPSTYVQASSTQLVSTGTTLASVLGAGVNVRLVATTGGVAVSVQEATDTVPGIVSTTTQTFAGDKTFLGALTAGPPVVGGVDGVAHLIRTGDQGATFSISTANAGTIQIANAAPTATAPGVFGISNDTGNAHGLFIGAAANDANTGGDMCFDVRESDNTDFATTANNAFVWRRFGNVLMSTTRAGAVMLGPDSGSVEVKHDIQGYAATGSNPAMFLRQRSTADANPVAYVAVGSTSTGTANRFLVFTINGTATGSGQINANGAGACGFGSFSDIRLKENIQPLSGELDKILSLNPVSFTLKECGNSQTGFIAQEMEVIYPDAVSYLGPDTEEMKTITGWDKTSARIVKAIQELAALRSDDASRIAELAAKLDAAQAEIDALKSRQS